MTLISASAVPASSKLRLAILYALRYQKLPTNSIAGVIDALIRNGVTADRARLVYIMLNFAGADTRQDDLFMNENFFSRGKTALKGLKVSLFSFSGVMLTSRGLRMFIRNIHPI
jgi:vacuolar protein sorting-associated protein 45